MKKSFFIAVAMSGLMFVSCKDSSDDKDKAKVAVVETTEVDSQLEQFADTRILKYEVPGWDKLSLKEQKLVFYLTQAGLAGRDIIWDQNYRHNLTIRKAFENIYSNYDGDKSSEDWKNFEIYLKRVWFSNGIHHHYSSEKFKADFSQDLFSNNDLEEDRKIEFFYYCQDDPEFKNLCKINNALATFEFLEDKLKVYKTILYSQKE